jgi:hypothetical protein
MPAKVTESNHVEEPGIDVEKSMKRSLTDMP